jgi:hypothetical protein
MAVINTPVRCFYEQSTKSLSGVRLCRFGGRNSWCRRRHKPCRVERQRLMLGDTQDRALAQGKFFGVKPKPVIMSGDSLA